MTEIYNFFTLHGYVLELLLAVSFFTWWMDKQRHFILRFLSVCIALFAVSMLWGLIPVQNAWTNSLSTILFFVLCTLGVILCFGLPASQAAFYSTAVGAAQHFSFRAARTLIGYCSTLPLFPERILSLAYPLLSVSFLLLCYFLFGKKLRREGADYLTSSPMVLFLLIGMQLCTNIFKNLFDQYSVGVDIKIYIIYSLFDIVCCLFLLSLQCEITKKANEQQNNAILNHLLYQQKQQMKMSKENIELINIKCHDIKNQIAMLGDHVPQDEIRELKRSINIYDMAFKTGNEALDVLMIEKLLLCESKNIRFDCMAEGSRLSFMSNSDIYSLFGNALDNAIEAVDKISDPDKRFISAKAHVDKNMMILHFENYYVGTIDLEAGLPKTTKHDKRYHGFGMKSIRMIVEKYGGYLSINGNNSIFTLNILLPLPVL